MGQLPKFITIEDFVVTMLGFKNKMSYYDHLHEPGWPQVCKFGPQRAMLLEEECEAYLRYVIASRPPPRPKKTRVRIRDRKPSAVSDPTTTDGDQAPAGEGDAPAGVRRTGRPVKGPTETMP